MGHRHGLCIPYGNAAPGHGNDGLLNIDPFKKGPGEENDHRQASQVPLGRQFDHQVSQTVTEPERFKVVAR